LLALGAINDVGKALSPCNREISGTKRIREYGEVWISPYKSISQQRPSLKTASAIKHPYHSKCIGTNGFINSNEVHYSRPTLFLGHSTGFNDSK
jgi:hypothetical protein